MENTPRISQNWFLILTYQNKELYRLNTTNYVEEITIGRSSECTWSVGRVDQTASGRHAMLSYRKGVFYITDLGSRNGVFLNGNRIKESKIAVGDVVKIGECSLTVAKAGGVALKRVKPDRLRYRDERGNNVSHPIKAGTLLVGNGNDCNIRLKNPLVSFHHLSIIKKNDGSCWIRDLRSKNGTFVNRQELPSNTERMLKDGDVISLADIDMTFWDGRVSHDTIRLGVTVLVLVASIVSCVLCYMLYQQFRPSSLQFIEAARNEARLANFSKAQEYMAQARTAKHASQHVGEYEKLHGKLMLWAETSSTWDKVDKAMQEARFEDIPQMLSTLNVTHLDYWDWNESDVLMKMDKAAILREVFDGLLENYNLRCDKQGDFEKLKASRDVLVQSSKKLSRYQEAGLAAIQQVCARRVDDTNAVLADYQKVLESLAKIKGKRFAPSQVLITLTDIHEKTQPILRERLEKLMSVFDILAKGMEALEQKKQLARNMEFDKCQELALVYPEKLKMMSELEAQVTWMREEEEQIRYTVSQLNARIEELKSMGVEPGKEMPSLADFSNSAVMDAVFACDSLTWPLPSKHRKKPVGVYDRVLGIDYFYAYLRLIGSGTTVRSRYDIPQTCVLEKAEGSIAALESILSYMSLPANQWLMAGGAIVVYRDNLKKQLMQRDQAVAVLLQHPCQAGSRDYFIRAGIIYALKPSFYSEVQISNLRKEFGAYREKLQELEDLYANASLEQSMQIRSDIMKKGLPGDPVVKRMWSQF